MSNVPSARPRRDLTLKEWDKVSALLESCDAKLGEAISLLTHTRPASQINKFLTVQQKLFALHADAVMERAKQHPGFPARPRALNPGRKNGVHGR